MKTDITTNGGGSEESDDGGISAILQASTETNLKFACLVRFVDKDHVSRKEILDAVLHLVSRSFGCLWKTEELQLKLAPSAQF